VLEIAVVKKATICFPEDVAREIEERARQERRTEIDITRDAVRLCLAARRRPLPSVVGMGWSGAISGERTDDRLRQNWAVE
jgi:hypothetical protein